MRGLAGLVMAGIVLLAVAGAADAATLKAKYSFHGSLASDVAGAPDLVDLGTGNRFARELMDGVQRPVRTFPQGGGLSLATTGLVDPSAHSVVMTFRLAPKSGYRRLLDFTQSRTDNGLYDLNGRPVLYLNGHLAQSDDPVIGSSYVQVALTSKTVPGGLQESVYVNGTPVASGTAAKDFGLSSGGLRFFKDNANREEAAGAVSCILIYDGTLSEQEVQQVAHDQTLCPAPTLHVELPQVTASGKPRALWQPRTVVLDTGLQLTCPIGTTPCSARGQVRVAAKSRRGGGRQLASVRLKVPAGQSRQVVMSLPARKVRKLAKTKKLRFEASAMIQTLSGQTAEARRKGTITLPQRTRLRTPIYSGTTSQGLPIFFTRVQNQIVSILFRWRATCTDNREHTGLTVLSSERIRHGRFVTTRKLRNRGTARVAGTINGSQASGTLSRYGPTAKTQCAVNGITWQAQSTPVETERRASRRHRP